MTIKRCCCGPVADCPPVWCYLGLDCENAPTGGFNVVWTAGSPLSSPIVSVTVNGDEDFTPPQTGAQETGEYFFAFGPSVPQFVDVVVTNSCGSTSTCTIEIPCCWRKLTVTANIAGLPASTGRTCTNESNPQTDFFGTTYKWENEKTVLIEGLDQLNGSYSLPIVNCDLIPEDQPGTLCDHDLVIYTGFRGSVTRTDRIIPNPSPIYNDVGCLIEGSHTETTYEGELVIIYCRNDVINIGMLTDSAVTTTHVPNNKNSYGICVKECPPGRTYSPVSPAGFTGGSCSFDSGPIPMTLVIAANVPTTQPCNDPFSYDAEVRLQTLNENLLPDCSSSSGLTGIAVRYEFDDCDSFLFGLNNCQCTNPQATPAAYAYGSISVFYS